MNDFKFDLESNILKTSSFSDQLRMVSEGFSKGLLDDDGLINALEGIAVLIELHEEKVFDLYKKQFGLDEYREAF